MAGKIFSCKKKSVGEFDEDVDDKGDNPLTVMEVELDAEDEVNSENMADWLKKLHMRTQHLVGKVTVNGMSRLAATNNVATALTRSIQCSSLFKINQLKFFNDEKTGSRGRPGSIIQVIVRHQTVIVMGTITRQKEVNRHYLNCLRLQPKLYK